MTYLVIFIALTLSIITVYNQLILKPTIPSTLNLVLTIDTIQTEHAE